MKGGLGALPTGLGALKIRVTSRPNGQWPNSNEFPTLGLTASTMISVLGGRIAIKIIILLILILSHGQSDIER